MAAAVIKPFSKAVSDEAQAEIDLVAECKRRIARAEMDRNRHASRIADCNKFALPWRHKLGVTTGTVDLDEIFDSTAMTVIEDFAADMLNTFTPMKNDWVEIKPTEQLDIAAMRQLERPLKEYQRVLFGEMARSNLYQALQESYLDLAIGTMALIVTDRGITEPLHCQAIAANELLIDRGPWGFVDGRWRKWRLRAEEVGVLWPNAKPIESQTWKPGDMTEVDVVDGCWRDWNDKANEAYRYVVLANDKIIYQENYKGQGSCPFITARWSRDSTTAWGVGPLYRSTPDVKTINHVKFIELKNHDKHADPVVSYEDDGIINVDNGVEPGKWIPRAAGSEAPEVIEPKTKLERTLFQIDQLTSAIRRAHYQDQPDQLGKTPPSATQWADEAARRARRMGTPATNLVQELQYPIIRRFAYLLAKRGVLPKLELSGQQIAVEPISPLLRAQAQEEVVRNDRLAELIVSRFGPQVGMIVMDVVEYADAQRKALGVDEKLVRKAEDIADAIKKLLPVLQNSGAVPNIPAIAPSAGAGVPTAGAPA